MISTREVVGLVMIVVGAGLILGSEIQFWLLNKGFRASPAFRVATRQERAEAEDRAEVAQRRFVPVGTLSGVLLVVLGGVFLAL